MGGVRPTVHRRRPKNHNRNLNPPSSLLDHAIRKVRDRRELHPSRRTKPSSSERRKKTSLFFSPPLSLFMHTILFACSLSHTKDGNSLLLFSKPLGRSREEPGMKRERKRNHPSENRGFHRGFFLLDCAPRPREGGQRRDAERANARNSISARRSEVVGRSACVARFIPGEGGCIISCDRRAGFSIGSIERDSCAGLADGLGDCLQRNKGKRGKTASRAGCFKRKATLEHCSYIGGAGRPSRTFQQVGQISFVELKGEKSHCGCCRRPWRRQRQKKNDTTTKAFPPFSLPSSNPRYIVLLPFP